MRQTSYVKADCENCKLKKYCGSDKVLSNCKWFKPKEIKK
jgi:hypothetical protein